MTDQCRDVACIVSGGVAVRTPASTVPTLVNADDAETVRQQADDWVEHVRVRRDAVHAYDWQSGARGNSKNRRSLELEQLGVHVRPSLPTTCSGLSPPTRARSRPRFVSATITATSSAPGA